LAYQPPASSTFLSEQISHQQPANNTFLSEQISTSHQPPAKRTDCEPALVHLFLLVLHAHAGPRPRSEAAVVIGVGAHARRPYLLSARARENNPDSTGHHLFSNMFNMLFVPGRHLNHIWTEYLVMSMHVAVLVPLQIIS
jgi:hypothetical protein